MKIFVNAKTVLAVVSMLFFVLACGSALAKTEDRTTTVHVSFDKSIWHKDFNGKRPLYMSIEIFDENHHLLSYGNNVTNTDNVQSLDCTATAPAKAKLKAFVSLHADSTHRLQSVGVTFKNDGIDKTYILEDLLAGK